MRLPFPSLLLTAIPALVCLVADELPGQVVPFQSKVFFNDGHMDRVERDTAGVDKIYQMVDPRFHRGWGKGAGFSIVLQDVDQATSELVKVGYVRNDASKPDQPDVTAAGDLGTGTFQLFGSGTGTGTYLWTLTLGTRVTLPEMHGMSIELPAAKLNTQNQVTDGVFLQNQSPHSLQLPTGATPKHWMWVLASTQAVSWDANPGGTWHFGSLYEAPVAQVFVRSKAYGKAGEALQGPESLFPIKSRGDLIGWDLESKALAVTGTRVPGIALVMIGAQAQSPALKTPWGDLFINAASVLTMILPLDKSGRAQVPGLAIPKPGIAFHTQTLFVDPNAAPAQSLSLSDAQFIVTY